MSESGIDYTGKASEQSPGTRLLFAMIALADFCESGAKALQALTDDRDEHQRKMIALVDAGASPDVLTRYHTISPEYAGHLKRIIAKAADACTRARKALADGGAAGWDEYTSQNSAGQVRSLEARTKLIALERTLPILEMLPDHPTLRAGTQIETLATLAPWFADKRDELEGVFVAMHDARNAGSEAEAQVTPEHLNAIRPTMLAELQEARDLARSDLANMAGANEVERVRRACGAAFHVARWLNFALRDPNCGRIRDGSIGEDVLFRFRSVLPWVARLDECISLARPTIDAARDSGAWDRLIAASPDKPEPWMAFAGCAPRIAWDFAQSMLLAAMQVPPRVGATCVAQLPPRIDDAAIAHSPIAFIDELARITESQRATDAEISVLEARMEREAVAERTSVPLPLHVPPAKANGAAKGPSGRSKPLSEMEQRLALSKAAISEAHGDIEAACVALRRGDHTDGEPVKTSVPTLYRHFNRLLASDSEWARVILNSQKMRNPSHAEVGGTHRNRRSKRGDSGRR